MNLDPITKAIISSVSAGIKMTEDRDLSDAYENLKALIKRKYNHIADALEKLDQRADSAGRQELMKEEVSSSGADKDPEILQAVKTLIESIRPAGTV